MCSRSDLVHLIALMLLCHKEYIGNLVLIDWFVDGLVGYNSLGCAVSAQFVFFVLCRRYIVVCSSNIISCLWEICEDSDRKNRLHSK